MEQQVWSIHMPDNQPCDLVSQCHIKSFQRASIMEKPWPGGEKRRVGQASHHVAWGGEWGVAPPVCATGVSLIVRGCLIDATPRG